jgi:hypothetical protein
MFLFVNNQYLKMKKPVGARGRQTLLTASVARCHSDHEKVLLSNENVRVQRKCQQSYADERTAAVVAKRNASNEQRYLHVRNKLI